MPPAIAPGALDRLVHYGWRGNVRELENLVERELIRHGRERQLMFNSLLPDPAGAEDSPARESGSLPSPLKLDEAMALHIQKVMKMTKGKIHGPGGAAELLGVNPNTLRGRMSRLGIRYGRNKKR